MIYVFTLGQPEEKIKEFAQEIFNLGKGAYNLSAASHPQLYKLGVRQIIHDGNPNEIQCMDGYLYANKVALGEEVDKKEILVIKPQ